MELIEGIVISEKAYGDTSKIINILTKDYGIIGVMSKGCKGVKSKLKIVSENFTYAYFYMYYKDGKLSTLIGADIINYFPNIKNDILIDWERLINEETNKRVRNFAFLLGQPYKERKSSRRRTISIFSGRKIVPFNGKGALLLLYFKILQRGKGNLILLLQIYFGILAFILFGDRLINSGGIAEAQTFVIISNMFSAYILGGFLSSLWINLKEDIWFQIYPYTLKQKISAIELAPTFALLVVLLFINIPLNLINGWIFNPIISLIGIIFISVAIIKFHSYLIMLKLKIN